MLSRNTFCTQFATGREWLFSSHTLQTKKKILCASQKIEKENTKDLTVELCQIASVCIRKRIIMSLQYWLILLYYVLRMNFYNHHIRSIFKSHSISVTFKFCAVHIAKFESIFHPHCSFGSNPKRSKLIDFFPIQTTRCKKDLKYLF